MSEKEWANKYPLSFIAFLADESAHKDKYYTDCERMFPESMIGDYLNWFLLKSGKDERIKQLEDALRDMGESLGFYAALDCWESGEMDDGKTSIAWEDCESLTYVENDDESPSTEIFGGKQAREILQKHKEILDTINKRGEE